jgi:hypothetical protein
MAHHFYLVEPVNVAVNLSPASDPRFKPDFISLLYVRNEKNLAIAQANILHSFQIEVELLEIPEINDLAYVRAMILDWIALHYDDEIALNCSGGVRLFSLLALEVFNQLRLPVFYVDSFKDRLIWLYHPELSAKHQHHYDQHTKKLCCDANQTSTQSYAQDHFIPINNQLSLKAFLGAMDVEVFSGSKVLNQENAVFAFCEKLAQKIDIYEDVISTLNRLASSTDSNYESDRLTQGQLHQPQLMDLIYDLQDLGYLSLTRHHTLLFRDEESRFFINGGWLEVYTHHLIHSSIDRKHIKVQDVVRGLEIGRRIGTQEVRNELDVAMLCNNRLYVIECKTQKYSKNADDVIYKLDFLQDLLGGVHCKAMLITYHALPAHLLSRASAMKIEVCAGPKLKDLLNQLQKWIAI